MKITKIIIENFRNFKHAEIDFEKNHALIGENGIGKTTILEAINLATQSGMTYLNEQDFNNEDAGNIKIEIAFDIPFLVKIPDSYVSQDIPCQSIIFEAHRREKGSPGKLLSEPFVTEKWASPIIYTDSSIFDKYEFKANIPKSVKVTEKGFEAMRKGGNPMPFLKTRLSRVNDYINFPDIFYFDRKREDETKIGFNSLLTKISKDLNWRFRKELQKEDLLTKWDSLYNSIIDTVADPKKDKIINPIRKKMQKIAGYDFSKLELSILDIEQPFVKSFFSKRDKTNQIDSRNLGSGISVLLAYFLLETISSLSGENIIFLIDEPELHLHPQLQIRMFKEFRESKHQIIYTTQSDCFIDISDYQAISRFDITSKIKPESLNLEEILEGKKIKEHLSEIKKLHQHKTIFSREDNQIFFARKCILVEGPAEKYGLPVIANTLDLQLGDATIISCNGKTKMPYYQLICKTYGISFFTLFDLDNKPVISDKVNARINSWADNNNVFYYITSFEKLLGISGNADHKGSETLIKIDNLIKNDIPDEIQKSIRQIVEWV